MENARRLNFIKIGLLPLIIFLVSLIPKIVDISSGLTIDELQWLFRSQIFIDAIITGQFSKTFLTAHPGVILMWITGLSLKLFYTGTQSFDLFLTIARLPVIVVTSLCILIIYFLLLRIIDYKIAFLASLLISLDPFLLSHSMIVQSDALLAFFICIALLSFYIFLTEDDFPSLYLSSFFSGLAILSKLSGVLVLLIAGISLLFLVVKKNQVRKILSKALIYFLGVVTTMFVIWPVLVYSPLFTIQGLLFGKVTSTSGRGIVQLFSENQNGGAFLFGICPNQDCGYSYYPVNILMKTSPLLVFIFFYVGSEYFFIS